VARSDGVKDSNKKMIFLQQLVLGKGLGFQRWPGQHCILKISQARALGSGFFLKEFLFVAKVAIIIRRCRKSGNHHPWDHIIKSG
jgi:hypothetical protein